MEVQQEFGDEVVFIGVPGLSNDADAKAQFLDQTGANTFAHLAEGGAIWGRFRVSEQRTYVYLNDDGTWEVTGYGSLRSDVEELIAR